MAITWKRIAFAEDVMSNPMTTAADMIVGGAGGTPARLAKGTALQILRMNADASAQEYAAPSGAGAGMPQIWFYA